MFSIVKRNILLFLTLFIFIASDSYANELKIAENYLKNKKYQIALNIFSKLAAEGNPKAQIKLGVMYKLGQGTTPNYIIASKWFNIAVASGYQEGLGYKRIMESRMTREQVLQSRKLANDWLETRVLN
jgi:TPR repeat protein|tara:strand:- start:41 stop:424 length:384 start_codon:yes stop_codon:yes gene_type:complete